MEREVAVVTGSSGGMGWKCAARLLGNDWTVYGIDLKEPTKPGVAAQNYTHLIGDLSQRSVAMRLVRRLEEEIESVDMLLNTVGVFVVDEESSTDESWARLWQGNVSALLWITKGLKGLLKAARGGLVVNIASSDAVVASAAQDSELGVGHDVHYSTTKGGVVSLTKSLAMAWAEDNIRVNALCPTIVPGTPMTEELFEEEGKRRELSQKIPLGELPSTSDIADAVEAMLKLKMTTAHILPIDGGYLCR